MKSLAKLLVAGPDQSEGQSEDQSEDPRSQLSRALAHSSEFEFFGAPFRVHATSRAPLAYLERIYRYFHRAGRSAAPCRMWIVEQGSRGADALMGQLAAPRPIAGHAVVVDSFDYAVVVAGDTMLRYYLSKLLRLAVVAASGATHLTLHAASVIRHNAGGRGAGGRGAGLLLIGEAAVGKTSLTLALIERGFRYGADDTTPVRRGDATCEPFPTPFIVRGDRVTGTPLLPELAGRPPDIALLDEPRWLVERWDSVAGPFRPDFLIFLDGQGDPGAVPISPANAAIELLRNVIFPLGADVARIPLHERYLDDALALASGARALRVGSRRPEDALQALLALAGGDTGPRSGAKKRSPGTKAESA